MQGIRRRRLNNLLKEEQALIRALMPVVGIRTHHRLSISKGNTPVRVRRVVVVVVLVDISMEDTLPILRLPIHGIKDPQLLPGLALRLPPHKEQLRSRNSTAVLTQLTDGLLGQQLDTPVETLLDLIIREEGMEVGWWELLEGQGTASNLRLYALILVHIPLWEALHLYLCKSLGLTHSTMVIMDIAEGALVPVVVHMFMSEGEVGER